MATFRGPGSFGTGPYLGDDVDGNGLFRRCSLGLTSKFRGPYREYYTDFNGIISIADMVATGWVETVVGTAASRSIAYNQAQQCLVVNADTVADEGLNIQNRGTLTTPVTGANSNLSGLVTSTSTLMDSRELIWATRVGFLLGAGSWTSKMACGWVVTDGALMTPSTGDLDAITTGGGIGFHITEAGQLNAFVQGTTSGALIEYDTGYDQPSTLTTTLGGWIDLGFRARWGTASTSAKSQVEFFVNGSRVANHIATGTAPYILPMRSTQGYSTTFELINGPATANAVDMGIEYVYMAMSRPGVTYPYTSGLNQ